MLALGIDPGTSGASALVDTVGQRLLECASLPICSSGSSGRIKTMIDANALARLLDGWADRHGAIGIAAVERMSVFTPKPNGKPDAEQPRVSSSSLLSMGYSAGVAEGVLWCLFGDEPAFRVLRPFPRTWKASYGLDSKKARSVELARRMFRALPDRFRHDLAEAALLAHWAGGGMTSLLARAAAIPKPTPRRAMPVVTDCPFE